MRLKGSVVPKGSEFKALIIKTVVLADAGNPLPVELMPLLQFFNHSVLWLDSYSELPFISCGWRIKGEIMHIFFSYIIFFYCFPLSLDCVCEISRVHLGVFFFFLLLSMATD